MYKLAISGIAEKNRDDLNLVGGQCIDDYLDLLEGADLIVTIEGKVK